MFIRVFRLFFFIAAVYYFPLQSNLQGFDIYGTTRLDSELFFEKYGNDFEKCLEKFQEEHQEDFARLKWTLEEKIKADFGFAYAEFSIVSYYIPEPERVFITLDIVEETDRTTRMRFQESPDRNLPDPNDLLLTWSEYMDIGWQLTRRDEIDFDRIGCSAFHSLFGHNHPSLIDYEEKFIEGAFHFQKELEEIFLYDANPFKRGNAAFLLSYMRSGEDLVRILQKGIFDEYIYVRNNVLRIFWNIAKDRPDILLPLADIFKLLNYPAATDRNKAAVILLETASRQEGLALIQTRLFESGPVLLSMLKLNQPINHDPAYEILKILSSEDFGETNYQAREEWYARSCVKKAVEN